MGLSEEQPALAVPPPGTLLPGEQLALAIPRGSKGKQKEGSYASYSGPMC